MYISADQQPHTATVVEYQMLSLSIEVFLVVGILLTLVDWWWWSWHKAGNLHAHADGTAGPFATTMKAGSPAIHRSSMKPLD